METVMGKTYETFMKHADTNGNGTGTKNAIGNYASTDTPFKVTNDRVGKTLELHRVVIYCEDDASFRNGGYGGLATLTDGIIVRVTTKAGGTIELTDGVPIKNFSDWGRLCYDVTYQEFQTGNNFAHVRWTFSKSGQPLRLAYGESLEFVMRDSFSGLVGHYFNVQGFWD